MKHSRGHKNNVILAVRSVRRVSSRISLDVQMAQERDVARRLAGQYYRKALDQEMELLRASGIRDETLQAAAENVLQARVREANKQWNVLVWGAPDGREPESL